MGIGASKSPSTARICVVGLGYVGLPLAYEFDAAGHDVSGYDVDDERIRTLESGVDPTGDVGDRAVAESSIRFAADASAIVGPTTSSSPSRRRSTTSKPDLRLVERAGETIGEHLDRGRPSSWSRRYTRRDPGSVRSGARTGAG